ncbi:hypothetical protein D9M68_636020 [compost metagenome]
MVDGQGFDRAQAGNGLGGEIPAQALGADDSRRVQPEAAIGTAQEAQLAICTAGPEEAVQAVQLGKDSVRSSAHGVLQGGVGVA